MRERTERVRRGLAALAITAALAVSALGALAGWQSRVLPSLEGARVNGLWLGIERIEWLEDQMQHGRVYGMPESMMPGMPPHGFQRLTVGIVVRNTDGAFRTFRAEELRVVEAGAPGAPAERHWEPVATELPEIDLAPGQLVNTVLHFDVDDTEAPLRLVWLRDVAVAESPVPPQPFHDHGEAPPVEWPENVGDLPDGRASVGKRVFTVRYNCAGCHGHPLVPRSNTMAPHLGAIGQQAAGRVPGETAAQYIYRSIEDPDAFVAPDCVDGRSCSEFASMPDFSGGLALQEMADLVAFLLEQRGS